MWGRLVLAVGLVAGMAASGVRASHAGAAGPGRGPTDAVQAASFAAQGDERDGDAPLDLPAMVPAPADLADDGYAVSYGQSRTLSGYAAYLIDLSGDRPTRVESLSSDLEEAGWRQDYLIWLSLASEDDPDFFARNIVVELVEYADDEGASTGYDLLTQANAGAGFDAVSGGEGIGDQAGLFRVSGTSTNGEPYRWLDLVFQSGPVVAQVSIVDFTNDSPPVSEAERLGADLADRIGAVLEDGSPGLGTAIQRIDAEGTSIYWDWYRRLDGETRRNYNETDNAYEANDENYDDVGVVDHYVFVEDLPAEDPDDPVYSYYAELLQFEDEDAAADYVQEQPQAFVESPAGGYSNVEIVDDAESYGDESTVVSFDSVRLDDSEASGFAAYVRSEDRVIYVEINGVPDVPLAAVETLVEGQVVCLEDGACDGWAQLPEELSGPGAEEADGAEGDGDEESADGDDEAVEVTLAEVEDSGIRGSATLTTDGDETEAAVELRGSDEGMLVAVQEGTCDDLDPDPVGDPEEVDEDGAATLAIPVALEDLLDDEYAVAVYVSEDDLGDSPLACGEIEA